MWKWRLFVRMMRLFARKESRYFRRLRGLQAVLVEELNGIDSVWTSTISRPKRPDPYPPVLSNDCAAAVIMQGPLRGEDDFTVETVRHYRRSMPAARIIVSTWAGEDAHAIERLQTAGARVVLTERPENRGPMNVNLQICGTRAGLAAAREEGHELVLKTRTDARIYSYHALDFFAGLMRAFPLSANSKQHARIVTLDFATRLLIPNHPSDMLMFGRLDDLEHFWSAPYSNHPERTRTSNMGTLWNEQTPELYLCESYLRSIGHPFERTIASWWRTLAELFVVVDRTSIDYFWPKYEYVREHRVSSTEQVQALTLCGFRDWMNLYMFSKQFDIDDATVQSFRCDEILRAA
jgi:hypothetical protein